MKESAFWQTVKRHLESADTHASRIENSAGTGISDVTACRNGLEVFLELKIFHGQRIHFRNSQRSWIVNRTGVGGRVKVVAKKEDEVLVYDGRSTVLCQSKPGTDGKSFSVHWDDLPPPLYRCGKPIDWARLKDVIFDPSPANLPEHLDKACDRIVF
jgi:hypothetical protein